MNRVSLWRVVSAALFAFLSFALPSSAFAQDTGIGFLYIDQPEVTVGSTQQIAIISNDEADLVGATLRYSVYDRKHEIEAVELSGNAALFEIPAEKLGVYTLSSVLLETSDGATELSLTDADTPEVTFDSVQGSSAALFSASNCTEGTSFYTLDNSDEISASTDDALEVLSEASAISSNDRTLSAGNFVVSLDPGHGGYDPGAGGNGLTEKDLTLKIARHCNATLNQYAGVRVYMTRNSDSLAWGPNDGDLKTRVAKSIDNGADVIVSLHINSGGGSGAEVWYPNNSSWKNSETHGQGQQLAQNVQNKLVALGLGNRGIKMRDYGTGGAYADGSMADYYAILREARKQGVPAIIIEHAFIDNRSDASKLADESWLKRMGEADAQGIAQTYGLDKKGTAEWKTVNGAKQYYVNGTIKKHWFMAGGQWYYANDSGNCLTGWQTINGKKYYLDPKEAYMRRGWLKFGGATYRLNYDGDMVVGWKDIDGRRYYFQPNGKMVTGKQAIDGKTYTFASDGALINKRGWVAERSHWYYYVNGAPATGWLNLNGTWYYLKPGTGAMATGWYKVNGTWYYSDASGAMRTGWLKQGGTWYYLHGSGAMATGWINLGGTWYYLNPSGGGMLTGWYKAGNNWYYSNGSGAMQTGWFTVNGTWYYCNGSGARVTGWLNQGAWYYLSPSNGAMQTGWYTVDNTWYYSNGTGAMITGWLNLDGTWYYLHGSGAMATGWLNLGGIWYYLHGSGAMATGWYIVDNTWYYSNGSGAMQTGWLNLGGTWYYLHGSGAMATGWLKLGDKFEYFSPSGAWNGRKTQSLTPIVASAGNKKSVVNSMVKAYSTSNANYPSKALGKGGASSIEEFCSILFDEAAAESIDPRVMYCQIMLETGWLKFGGAVKVDQFNFGGIGATDNGAKPVSFPDVRTGLRAHTQHLKAYAVKSPKLTNSCVDPRFHLVKKGSAPYVQYLGIKENPNGAGWASSVNYGILIVDLVRHFF